MEFLCFIPLLFFLLIPSHVAADPASYFIDCGSRTTTSEGGQNFTGDTNLPSGVKLRTKNSNSHTFSSKLSSIYQTGREFTSPAYYQFDTSEYNGSYLLRLHFFTFSLSSSLQFNVSANGHTLLKNFRGSDSPVSKEFLIPVQTREETLNVYFLPVGSSGLAFVNAIEVIPADLSLTNSSSWIMVNPEVGYNGSFGQLGPMVLSPIYRINVGGSNVSDSLRRSWWQDDDYLVAGKSFATKQGPAETINYREENSTNTDAPPNVYKTARGWKPSSNSTWNATWSFNMNKGSSNYSVRVHLCDILSIAHGEITFNLYFFSKFVWQVYGFNVTYAEATPFCLDFVVQSDYLGFVNITIGSIGTGGAFLNGLEIMEFVNGSTVEPKLPGKDRHVVLIACVVSGVFAFISILVSGFVWVLKIHRTKAKPAEEFEWPLVTINEGGSLRSSMNSLPSLNLRIPIGIIQQVTNNFDEALQIGRGGFGKVYKGVLKNGQKVAVKRSDSKHGQGLPEFQAEITVLSKIRHRHLVSLIGYCDENDEMILVYEFMGKGTLRDHLYGDERKATGLSWNQRLEICIGAARGLHYLHTGSTGGIIHRDVKSTNILLDDSFTAKVADFGLSRAGGLDQDTHVSTLVKGTFGYLDPEYYQCMQLTEKSDVYSFGVLLLEVLCARLVLDPSLPGDEVNLADWAMSCKVKGDVDVIIDPLLAGRMNPSVMNKFVETAEKCLKESGSDRPPMSDVVWDLEYILQLHKFGEQGARYGDSSSTTDASFNLPMLAVPEFSSTALGLSVDGVSGSCGDGYQVSQEHSELNDSM